MASAPLILLPPSEGKAPGGDGPAWAPGTMAAPELDGSRAKVLAALASTMRRGSVASRSALLGVKGDALAAATAANLDARTAPTRPAIERYTGVLYGELDAANLPARSRTRLAEQVLILSGAWGVVGPLDPIPDYKLKMGVGLGRLGRLSTFWRPAVSSALDDRAAGRTVWNLLPNEHDEAWRPGGSGARPGEGARTAPELIVRVRFLDEVERGGERRLTAVSHWNKLLKGALVRHVLHTRLDDPAGLVRFEHPLGYAYEPGLDDEPTPGQRTVSFVKRLP